MTTTLAPTDPRSRFARATLTARRTVAAITPDQYALPTPCTEFDVAHLLGHLHGVFGRLAAAGRGEDPMSVNTEPPFAPISDYDAAFLAGAQEVHAAWTDPATLERLIVFPWATLPGAAAMAMYTSELTVHTWDLARATGQSPDWDDDVVAEALAFMTAALPADGRAEAPFADVVPVPADAPAIDRLVAWNGRQP